MYDGHLCVFSPVPQDYPVVGLVLIGDDRPVAKTVEWVQNDMVVDRHGQQQCKHADDISFSYMHLPLLLAKCLLDWRAYVLNLAKVITDIQISESDPSCRC